MQKFLKQKNDGFTLVETLVAISIFTISLLGIMSILANNITNIEYAKQKMTATYLAQEGIEYVRNQRDKTVLTSILLGSTSQAGWNTFYTTPISLISPSAPSGDLANYGRSITKTAVGSDEVTIVSTVCWPKPAFFSDCSSVKNKVSFSENLYNWIE